jgi:hypothetical protein
MIIVEEPYTGSPGAKVWRAMPRRGRRILEPLTDERYSDEEGEAARRECEECAIAELADGTIDE